MTQVAIQGSEQALAQTPHNEKTSRSDPAGAIKKKKTAKNGFKIQRPRRDLLETFVATQICCFINPG